MTEQTTQETMSAAYDQGVEDGIRQERERIREALLSDGAIGAVRDAWRDAAYAVDVGAEWATLPDPMDVATEALIEHIGLVSEGETK